MLQGLPEELINWWRQEGRPAPYADIRGSDKYYLGAFGHIHEIAGCDDILDAIDEVIHR